MVGRLLDDSTIHRYDVHYLDVALLVLFLPPLVHDANGVVLGRLIG